MSNTNIYDSLYYIYDYLNTNLNNEIMAEGLTKVSRIYRGLQPIEYILVGGNPIVIIYYTATSNINDNYDAWEAETSFNIEFKYPINLAGTFGETDDYTAKYAGLLLTVLTNLQYPNGKLKVFQIRNLIVDKSESNGSTLWLGFTISCIMKHIQTK